MTSLAPRAAIAPDDQPGDVLAHLASGDGALHPAEIVVQWGAWSKADTAVAR